jgi:hypothetical protein
MRCPTAGGALGRPGGLGGPGGFLLTPRPGRGMMALVMELYLRPTDVTRHHWAALARGTYLRVMFHDTWLGRLFLEVSHVSDRSSRTRS